MGDTSELTAARVPTIQPLFRPRPLIERALGSVGVWWIICLYFGAITAWSFRHQLNPDGLSYLDLSSAAATAGPGQLINSYWSPAYPALLGLATALVRPAPEQELPLAHLVGFLIFAATLGAFTYFFRQWFTATFEISDESAARDHGRTRGWVAAFAFSGFLWFTLRLIGMHDVTPDLAVAAIVFLAAGIVCRTLQAGGATAWRFALLGAVLAFGYYLKAVMFPLGLALIVILAAKPPYRRESRRLVGVAAASFAVCVAPWVGLMSQRAGAPSIGSAGPLNYAWYVNGSLWDFGEDPADFHTTPDHPAPKLAGAAVPVLRFDSPQLGGTYPLWYDPTYWYRSTKARFRFGDQFRALLVTGWDYKNLSIILTPLLAGALVLWIMGLQGGARWLDPGLAPASPRFWWWQFAWPLAALALYALVHVEARFLAGFLALAAMAIYGRAIPLNGRRVTAAVTATVLAAALYPLLTQLAKSTADVRRDLAHPSEPAYVVAARELHKLGLKEGDPVAVAGYVFDNYHLRAARLKIVAQIPNTRGFWALGAAQMQSLAQNLGAATGAKAVLARVRPGDGVPPAGWREVGNFDGLRISLLPLSPLAEAAAIATTSPAR